MMKIKYYTLLLLATVVIFGCSKYDDTELKNDVTDLKSRVEKLEAWCATTNTQISALQGLVTALEAKEFVTGVTPIMEGSKEMGYTITFSKSKPITIMHGKDGAKGEMGETGAAGKDGVAPVIGVKQDTDTKYYWTVKIGNAEPVWMTDIAGDKIPTTGSRGEDGKDGHSPVLSVAEFEEVLYWKIDGEWLDNNGKKVPATGAKGAQGDAVFAEDGIDHTTDPANVIFTLADGTTKITLPKSSLISVGFDSYEIFYGSPTNNEITLVLPATFKEADYTTITATMTNESGTGMDIQTRSAATTKVWGVTVTKPSFTGGNVVAGSAKVALTAPTDIKYSETAMLKVTITDKNGKDFTIARPVKYFDGTVVDCTGGNLSAVVTNTNVAKLAIKGSVDATDFGYIRTSLTALEVLDLSLTDMAVMPDRGLAFYNPLSANNTLKRVILPATVTAIEEAAFANCLALETIDTENAQSLGKWAFENCKSLRNIHLGVKLETINQSAFTNCTALNSIDIPGNVRTLGRWLFEKCDNLETITLHEGLKDLSQSTFYGCGVVSIRIPSTVTAIPEWTFQDCKKLERITMHDGITEIGESAFLRCYSLKNIKIPVGVTVIRNNMFDECQSLQRITFHDGITEIQERAFAYCLALTADSPTSGRLTLPASLSILGNQVFGSCNSLLTVDMSNTNVTAIPNNLFSDCEKLNGVMLPTNLQTISDWAFGGCSMLAGISLPASMTTIGDFAFYGCANLKQVNSYADTAPTIGTNTFDPTYKSIRNLIIHAGADYSAWENNFGSITRTL